MLEYLIQKVNLNCLLQKYLLSCSAFDPWSLERKNLVYIVMMVSVAWLIPLLTITGCYLKVNATSVTSVFVGPCMPQR